MRNLPLSLSSASLATLALIAPAQAQMFPGFNPGAMGQLDRMCNQNNSATINTKLPGLDNTWGDTLVDGTKSMRSDCSHALNVYNSLGRAGFQAHVDATRAMASAQSKSAMIGGIGSIFSGIISAASNRNAANAQNHQQTIAAQQQQIEQLKQMIIAQQTAQAPAYPQQQPQLASHQQQHYQYQPQPAPRHYNPHQQQHAPLRQTNLF